MITMKFGGSCFKGIRHIKKVVEIISNEKEKKIIVVSAFYGITNQLINHMMDAVKSEGEINENIEKLREKHKKILRAFGIGNLSEDIENRLEKLRKLLIGIHYTEEITPQTKAAVISYGERFAAIVLSQILNKKGLSSVYIESDNNLILADNSFDNATANLKETKKNIQDRITPYVKKGVIPVVTGFFGANQNGKTVTFGRNGSDYSASVIAYGTNSKRLILWKDAQGFMSADPEIIKDSKQIKYLSYYEAAELSYFGAKIIHPRTFEPLMRKNIEVLIKDIKTPESEPTYIKKDCLVHDTVIKSVTYNDKVEVLRVYGTGVGEKPGIISKIGKSLSDNGINIISIITAQTCINLLVDKHDSLKGLKILKRYTNGIIKKVELERNIALIGLVGAGLKKTKGVFARVFQSVSDAGVNIEMISGGASDVAYYIIVRKKDLIKTIRAIHKEFFSHTQHS